MQIRLDRRHFVKLSGAALAAGTAAWLAPARSIVAKPTVDSTAETAVKQFYGTLSDSQKKAICLPFQHQRYTSANWAITEPNIGDDFYSKEQRELIHQILRGATSEDGYQRLLKQMSDDLGGIEQYSVAIFGEPGSGKFEWE